MIFIVRCLIVNCVNVIRIVCDFFVGIPKNLGFCSLNDGGRGGWLLVVGLSFSGR